MQTEWEESNQTAPSEWSDLIWIYRLFSKIFGHPKNYCNYPISTMWLDHGIMNPKYTDGMANSVDPDQTDPLGAV